MLEGKALPSLFEKTHLGVRRADGGWRAETRLADDISMHEGLSYAARTAGERPFRAGGFFLAALGFFRGLLSKNSREKSSPKA